MWIFPCLLFTLGLLITINQVRVGGDNPKIKGIKLEKEIFQLEEAKQVVSQNMSAIFTLLAIVAVFAAAVIIGVRRQQG